MQCPSCGDVGQKGIDDTCTNCGQAMNLCADCGFKNPLFANFCLDCSEALTAKAAAQPRKFKIPWRHLSYGMRWMIVLLSLGTVLGILLIVFWLTGISTIKFIASWPAITWSIVGLILVGSIMAIALLRYWPKIAPYIPNAFPGIIGVVCLIMIFLLPILWQWDPFAGIALTIGAMFFIRLWRKLQKGVELENIFGWRMWYIYASIVGLILALLVK